MDIQSWWLLILSLATPIAGVVGFSVQLRQVKKARLENEKLQLEIAALKSADATRDQRIVHVSTEEVLLYAGNDRPRFSRRVGLNPAPDAHVPSGNPIASYLALIGFGFLVVTFFGYFLYDIYRMVRWLVNAF